MQVILLIEYSIILKFMNFIMNYSISNSGISYKLLAFVT